LRICVSEFNICGISGQLVKEVLTAKIEGIKNEHIKEIMGVKEKPDIIDIIERRRLQWFGHVKRMQEERLPKLIIEWIPGERRKRGYPRKTWMGRCTNSHENKTFRSRSARYLYKKSLLLTRHVFRNNSCVLGQ
jgi:hypothetical protein